MLFATCAGATSLLPGFSETDIPRPDGAATWNEAVGLTFSASGRMFVWERGGRVWIIDSTNPVTQPFFSLTDEVLAFSDHGMLGFALDPDFEQNGYVYALYTVDPYHLAKCDSPAVGAVQCAVDYSPDTTWIPTDPASPGYKQATIGRVARYQAVKPAGDSDYRRASQTNYGSRRVLLGETLRTQPKNTGIPILYDTHGIGTLLFGEDGTLLVSAGDSGSAQSIDVGSAAETYYLSGLADGVIQAKENVGALRSQLIDSLNGKILRLDPVTGDGLISNPYYDSAAPRAARSRVWARGLRNPYRMTLRPESGSHLPQDGLPGVIYVGDVGENLWEELDVVRWAGQNFGWPLYEGMQTGPDFAAAANVQNPDAPNPLFGGGCTLAYFRFTDLLKQDTLNPPSYPNPCNAAQQIPLLAHPSLHSRPVIDYNHDAATTRWAAFALDGSAIAQPIGVTAPDGTLVTGSPFRGSTSLGGVWFDGTGFPPSYSSTYLHGDYSYQWIKSFTFDANDQILGVNDFATNAGGVVALGSNPHHDGLYYIAWTAFVRKVTYAPPGGSPPVAVATGTPNYGISPLTVNFSSAGSADPDGGLLTYQWNFGDGTSSTAASPQHVYTAPTSAPTNFTATLTVRDPQGLQAQATVLIYANNTPPSATITSPLNGSGYSVTGGSFNVNLTANISDLNTPTANLVCTWQKVLYHNQHEHSDPFINSCSTTVAVTPLGCDGQQYSYGFRLWVYDAQGLSASDEVKIFPNCPALDSTPPSVPAGLTVTALSTTRITLSWSAASDTGTGVAGYHIRRDGVPLATVTSTSFTDSELTPGTAYAYTVTAFDNAVPANESAPSVVANATTLSTSNTAIRVNTGGGAYTDSLGQLWVADTGFNTGSSASTSSPIAGTIEDALYQTERWDGGAAPELQYSFTVPNGSYQVRLYFAENFLTGAGKRVFNVDIEGVRRFSNVDAYAEAGGAHIALVKSVTVNVTDGQLNIAFLHQVEDPMVDAIEIVAQGTVITNDPTVWEPVILDYESQDAANPPPTGQVVAVGSSSIGLWSSIAADLAPLTVIPRGFGGSTAADLDHYLDRIVLKYLPRAVVIYEGDNDIFAGQTPTAAAGTMAGILARISTRLPNARVYIIAVKISPARVAFATQYRQLNQMYAALCAGDARYSCIDVMNPLLDAGGQPVAAYYQADGTHLSPAGYQVWTAAIRPVVIPQLQIPPPADSNAPAIPAGLTATALSASQIALSWSTSSDAGTGLAGYRILRGGVPLTTVTATSFTDTGLNANTTYSYTVTAFDRATPANESAPSTAASARTLAPDTTPPSVPAGLTATALSTTQVALSWSASTDAGTGVAGYRILRGGVPLTTVTTTSFTDSGLTANTTYTYTVTAFDNAVPANESAPSTAASARTPSVSNTVIRVNTGGGAYTDTLGQLWAADTGFNTGSSATSGSAIANTVEDTLYQSERWDGPAAPELQYSFTVPNGSYQVRLHFAENFVSGAGKRVFNVDMEGVRRFSNVDVFTEAGGANRALVKSVTLNVTDGQLNIVFLHQVEDPKIDAIEVIGQGPDVTPPSVPAGLTATALSTTQVALSWSASTDAGTGVAGYRILRGGVPLTTITTTSFTDSGLTANTTYTYTVTAFDGATPANESAPSTAASAKTLAPDTSPPSVPAGLTATALSTTQIALSWSASSDAGTGLAGYRILRGGVPLTTVTTTSFTDSGLTANTTYTYTVTAFDNAVPANESLPSVAASAKTLQPVVDTTAPSVPAGLTATALSTTQVALSWSASTDAGTGVAGYRIRRGGVPLSTVTTTSFTDTGLTANTAYVYTVSAYDNATPANESLPSGAANVTTLSASNTTIRVNTGGGAYTDTLGQLWAADTGFNTGSSATSGSAIANTVEDTLYQSERWDGPAAPELQYSFTVPNGSYQVRLHFAENFVTGAGNRVFNVDMEGVRRFSNVDVFTEAGGANRALVKSVTLNVTDGQLNIVFLHQVEDPKIDAIEIIGQ